MIRPTLRKVLLGTLALGFATADFAATPKHGWLSTRDNYILNENGNIVQLKGMSFFWSTEAWPGYSFYNAGTLNALVDDWKCTVVRVAYDRSSGWSGCQAVIDAAIAKGIYVILDWHCHDAENNTSQAVSWFTEKANAYKNTPNIIFEPYNEPVTSGSAVAQDGSEANAVKTWNAIKPYFTSVTKAIRQTGAKNLIIIGTPYYCQHPQVAANDPPKDDSGNPFENIAYSFHFYAASHGPNAYYVERDGGGYENTYLEKAVERVPVFVTEWGTTHRDGGEGGANTYVDEANTDWWFDNFINKYHLGHCNWSVSSFQTSSAFNGSASSPSASGAIAKRYIQQGEDEFVPDWILGYEGPSKDSTFTMPSEFHAASRFNRFYGTHAESASVAFSYRDAVDRRIPGKSNYTALKITPSEQDNWVSYNINLNAATKCLLVRYMAALGKGTIEIIVDDNKEGEIELQTPSSTTAPWITATLPVEIASGDHTLKFNFINTTGTYYNIEWFQLFEGICSTSSEWKPVKSSVYMERASITPVRNGVSITLPATGRFTGYTLMRPDGRTVKNGAIGGGARSIAVNNLSTGLWLLRLDGHKGVQMHQVVVAAE